MKLTISDLPMGTRPQVALPDPSFLTHLGEAGMRQLVSDHYDRLVESSIKNLFPQDAEGLASAKQHAGDFFIQICRGPRYYEASRGQPQMAKRHAPFKITPEARVIWLQCYQPLLEALDMPEDLVRSFWDYLDIFSVWMVNTR